MITAVVFSPPGRLEALGLTLAALVRGVTEGAIADAVIVLEAPDPEVAFVADEAGAKLTVAPPGADPWTAGAARARRQIVFCLEAGDVPGAGWTEAVESFARGDGKGRLGRLRLDGGGLALRACVAIERFAGTRRPRSGDVLDRGLLIRLPFRPSLRPVMLAASVARSRPKRRS